MFIPDMPNVSPQNVPVMIAQANQAQSGDVKTIRTLGVCSPVPNEKFSLENAFNPKLDARAYSLVYEHREVQGLATATITVLQQPKQGILRLVTEADRGILFSSTSGPIDPTDPGYVYLPEKGYLGKDKAVVLVDIGGIKIKVVYFFQAISGGLGNYGLETYCAKTGPFWKISANLDANGNSTLTAVDYQAASMDVATLASTLGSTILSSTSGVSLSISDLPSGELGQTTGTSITLDDNASGYNWFIDASPLDNSEFLPTSNPYEWVAKEGSAAYGKMDMLSVLLHEYGHALGIEHSADGHDYMAATLTAGVRRLPSAEELALIQQLVGEVKVEMASVSTQGSGNTPS